MSKLKFAPEILSALKLKLEAFSHIEGSRGCIICNSKPSGKYSYISVMRNKKDYRIAGHRLAFLLAYGELDSDLHVCHKCDNPKCVNPDHLFQGTAKDNQMDSAAKGRKNTPKKISDAEVKSLRNCYNSSRTHKEIAEFFNISQPHVTNVLTGKERQPIEKTKSCEHEPVLFITNGLAALNGYLGKNPKLECNKCGKALNATFTEAE